MTSKRSVRAGRIYDEPDEADRTRVLVDRLWPRGVSKDRAALDEWCKQIAPSADLRTWYSHDPTKFEEFKRRYEAELQEPERAALLDHLRRLAKDKELVLLTATRRVEISEAAVLAELINDGPRVAGDKSATAGGRR